MQSTIATTSALTRRPVRCGSRHPLNIRAMLSASVVSKNNTIKQIPIDDLQAFSELSQIHEVMVKDFSGTDTGLLNLTSRLSLCLPGVVIGNLIIPHSFDPKVRTVLLIPVICLIILMITGIIYSVKKAAFQSTNNISFATSHIALIKNSTTLTK